MESESENQPSVISRFSRWLLTPDPAKRYSFPGLIAYHWTSGDPKACPVGNISSSGMYVHTDERWLPGSIMPMTLQADAAGEGTQDWIAVLTQVVRSGPDGFGLAFVYSDSSSPFGDDVPLGRIADNKCLKRFLSLLLEAL